MNAASIVVLAIVIALAVLAVWRNVRKGAPCECGGSCASLRFRRGRRGGCHACRGHCDGEGLGGDAFEWRKEGQNG